LLCSATEPMLVPAFKVPLKAAPK